MFANKPSLLPALLASAAISVATVSLYHLWQGRGGSQSQRRMVQESLADLIKQNPDLFLNAMNDAATQQQEKVRTDMEKTATEMKDKLLQASISFGSSAPGSVRFIAFLDPMCPHCNEFQKIAFHVIKQRGNVGVDIIPVAVLGQNSEAMARFMLVGALQGADKLRVFQEKFIDNIADINRQKLLDLAKSSGFDLARLEKDELSEETEKTLARNGNLAEQIKLQGVPTVFVVDADGKLSLVPPMNLEGFNALVDGLTAKMQPAAVNKEEAKPTQAPKADAKPQASAAVNKEGGAQKAA
jgi:protein-disulfide isomerase